MTMAECSVMVTLTVLLAIQPVCCTQSTYYVKPTPDTPCPSEPCLTLSEYTQGAGPLFTSNTTMVFLPGDHQLYNDMGITNITTFTMVGDSATLTSNIVCTGPAAFIFQNISYLKIHALELGYCGSATLAAMQLSAIPQFELSNSAFYNSRNTSLKATGSDLAITETRFHGSSGAGLWLWGCTAEFLGSNVFSNNLRSGVRSYWSIITFNGTASFVNNSGESGGGIVAVRSTVHCSGSISFVNNKGDNFGGGIFADGSSVSGDGEITFAHNSAEFGGGVSSASGSNLVFSGNITITGNSASVGGGMVILQSNLDSSGNIAFVANYALDGGGGLATMGSTVNFDGTSSFIDNIAVNDGGSVYAGSGSDLSFKGTSTFFRNSAFTGGGICIRQGSSLNIHKGMTSFENNSAERTGGGISVWYSTVLCEGNTKFINNLAEFGGGVSGLGSNLIFSGNISFTSNKATSGGGINVQGSSLNCAQHIIFAMNLAEYYGGGIRASNSSVICEGICSFVNNSAEYAGGGVSLGNSTALYEGKSTFINNSAEYGGGIYADESNLMFTGNVTFSSNRATYAGGGIVVQNSAMSCCEGNSTFINNSAEYGGGMAADESNLMFTGNVTFSSNRATYAGGGIVVQNSAMSCCEGNSTFIGNSAKYGGGMATDESNLMFTGNVTFSSNRASYAGGGIDVQNSVMSCCEGNSTFIDNSAEYGGGIYANESNLMFTGNVTFSSNRATYVGGGIVVRNSVMSCCEGNSIFIDNSAVEFGGGVISSHGSILTWNGVTIFRSNSAFHGAGIYIEKSGHSFEGYICFKNNSGTFGGGIKLMNGVVSVEADGILELVNNSAIFGGAILGSIGTNLTANGNCTFTNNTAKYSGGAMFLGSGSSVTLSGYNRLVNNSADYGGGMHLTNSSLTLMGTTVFQTNTATSGGGVHGKMATITINGNTTFDKNSATLNGGGLSISGNSKCFLAVKEMLYFNGNHARQYGGAVFIADDPFVYCSTATDWNFWGQCFFQFPEWDENSADICCTTANNTAGKAGRVLYGGMIDVCRLTPEALNPGHVFDEIFDITEHISKNSVIASDPNHICPCPYDQPDCSIHSINTTVYPGETFLVPAVAIGQRNGTVPAVVKSSLEDEQSMLDSLQEAQSVNNTCTTLQYAIYSKSSKETMTLTAEGPCLELGEPLIINITLLQCPTGFTLSNTTKACTCEKRVQKYTNICNITSRKIDRDGDFWVGVDSGFEGTILHPHCPFDYCKSQSISFALNETDLQCSYDRTGLLCGGCQPGLSNVLGSSRCTVCSGAYLSLLIPFALAGIALVVFLLLCKLTVTVGSINGLIFYANIIAVNHSVLLPSGEQNVLTIFIAWLNLDLGIETCFYDGMDTYARTWLQFAFPLYVWVIVGAIIIFSHYYGAVARMFGRNPIAVLATLFLLSYAKLLRTIIAVLSFTYLEYPDGAKVAVWLYDGNVRYLKGKHIPLFLTALLVLLLLFLPYTLFLLFGQWIQTHSEKRIFSWISNYRVKPFLDAYHAPYRNEYRYWPGLLLVLQCILFLVFAFNVLGNPSVNLLAISVCITVLMIFARFTIINHFFDTINVSYLLNIGVLASGTLYVRYVGGRQDILAYTSLSIAFTTFLGILIYHVLTQLRDSRVWKEIVWPKLQRMRQRTATLVHRDLSDTETQGAEPEIVCHAPTTTSINLRELLLETH